MLQQFQAKKTSLEQLCRLLLLVCTPPVTRFARVSHVISTIHPMRKSLALVDMHVVPEGNMLGRLVRRLRKGVVSQQGVKLVQFQPLQKMSRQAMVKNVQQPSQHHLPPLWVTQGMSQRQLASLLLERQSRLVQAEQMPCSK